MGFIRINVTAIRINPIVKPSQNTQTSNLNAASAAALFDFAIELSYGNPGETKRLCVIIKPNTNSNHVLPIGIRKVQNHPVQQKKKKLLFRIDFRELAIGKFAQKWRKVGGYGGVLQSPYCHLWPNQPVPV